MTRQILALPSCYLVTPEPLAGAPFSDFIAQLECALESGIALVQLRAKTLSDEQYALLAKQALACCRRYSARLLLNASPELAQLLGADGVHLTSTRLMACNSRPLPKEFLVSAACHDEKQVTQANQVCADLLTISPVLPTATHTTAEPLGWPRFQALASLTSIPVYALGGMSLDTLAEAKDRGAHGVAAIRAFWGRRSC